MTCAPHPAAPHSAQLLQCSMCCVQWRQQQPDANALHRQLDQAWQGASPLQRRLAVATATTLRRPPHPLRRTGTAQHHLSPMRASSTKRHNAGGERARARRKAAWCRCRRRPHSWRLRLGFSPNEAWRAWQRFPASAARLNARPADATLRSGAKTGCFVWKLRPR